MEELCFLQFQQMSLEILGNQIHLENGWKIDVLFLSLSLMLSAEDKNVIQSISQ